MFIEAIVFATKFLFQNLKKSSVGCVGCIFRSMQLPNLRPKKTLAKKKKTLGRKKQREKKKKKINREKKKK